LSNQAFKSCTPNEHGRSRKWSQTRRSKTSEQQICKCEKRKLYCAKNKRKLVRIKEGNKRGWGKGEEEWNVRISEKWYPKSLYLLEIPNVNLRDILRRLGAPNWRSIWPNFVQNSLTCQGEDITSVGKSQPT